MSAGAIAGVVPWQISEEIRFVPSPGGGQIYTVLTLPTATPPSRLALICPPVFEEHGRAYAVLRELARTLGAHGIATLRFDYVGVGESFDDRDVFTMNGATADAAFLLGWLSERFPSVPIVPVGTRFGARVALDAVSSIRDDGSPQRVNIATPLLLDPVLDASEYLLSELRRTVAGMMMVYRRAIASRDDIVRETLEAGVCEREGFALNQIDGYTVTRELLHEAKIEGAPKWSYPGAVHVVVALQGGDGEREKRTLSDMLPAMSYEIARDDQYWTQPPIYSQVRTNIFDAARRHVQR